MPSMPSISGSESAEQVPTDLNREPAHVGHAKRLNVLISTLVLMLVFRIILISISAPLMPAFTSAAGPPPAVDEEAMDLAEI